jgi:hypothetical protein
MFDAPPAPSMNVSARPSVVQWTTRSGCVGPTGRMVVGTPPSTGVTATITRTFTSLSQAAEEAQSARVYGGLHFREGCVAGGRQATQIGRFVIGHELRPLRGK